LVPIRGLALGQGGVNRVHLSPWLGLSDVNPLRRALLRLEPHVNEQPPSGEGKYRQQDYVINNYDDFFRISVGEQISNQPPRDTEQKYRGDHGARVMDQGLDCFQVDPVVQRSHGWFLRWLNGRLPAAQ